MKRMLVVALLTRSVSEGVRMGSGLPGETECQPDLNFQGRVRISRRKKRLTGAGAEAERAGPSEDMEPVRKGAGGAALGGAGAGCHAGGVAAHAGPGPARAALHVFSVRPEASRALCPVAGKQTSSLPVLKLPAPPRCALHVFATGRRTSLVVLRRAALTNTTSANRFVATSVVERARVGLAGEGPAVWRRVAAALQLTPAQRADVDHLWRALR